MAHQYDLSIIDVQMNVFLECVSRSSEVQG